MNRNRNKFFYAVDILMFLLFALFPIFGSILRITMMGRILCFIILAYSLDLVWGYGGLINMGQGVFFGIGAYVAAISLVSREGVPMYMSNLGIKEIPGYVKFLDSNVTYPIMALVLPALLAGIVGCFIFSSKIKGIFFSLITMTMVKVFELAIQAAQSVTGGFNGIGGIPKLYFDGESLNIKQMYYVVLAFAVLAYLFCRYLTNSKFGKIIRATKDNEQRVNFLGYNSANFKIILFMISGMLAGLAGMLFAPMNGMVSSTDVGLDFSTTLMVALAVGGRGNLTGAALGTVIVYFGKSYLSELFPNVWQLILGVVLILVVFFMPEGIVGKAVSFVNRRKSRKGAESV